MLGWLPSLGRDQRGAAAVEFGLWSILFFVGALGAFDLADMYMKRSQMSSAVSAASLQAFDQRDNVQFSAIPAYVRSIANDSNLAVTVSCNGVAGSCVNNNRTCACLTQQATYVAQTCGTPCTGNGMTTGVNAGYYLTISTSHTATPAFLNVNPGSTQLVAAATVRLQ